MANKVFWIVPNQVIYLTLYDAVSIDDFRDSSTLIADLMEEAYNGGAVGPIIGVIDLRDAKMGQLLRAVISSAAQQIADVIDARHWKAKPGFVVLISLSETAKMLTGILIRISKQPMTSVGSMKEALMVVRYMYPELADQLDAYENTDRSASLSG